MTQNNDMDFLLSYKFNRFFNKNCEKDINSIIFINKKIIEAIYVYDDSDSIKTENYIFYVVVGVKGNLYKVSGHFDMQSAYKELKTLMNVLQGLPYSLDFDNLGSENDI